jgi:acyl-CoA synthetase (AMP-forming)/AMP-acid ligase II
VSEASLRGDLVWGTVGGLVAYAGSRFGPAEALVDAGQRWSFDELASQVKEAARAFLALGLEKGDRVAVWAPNSWEWVVGTLGALSAGGTIVPLNTRFKGEEAAWILNRSRARFLLTFSEFLGTDYLGLLAGSELPDLEASVTLRGSPKRASLAWGRFLAGADKVAPSELDARAAACSPEDVSDVIFTSGTTGRPKGVVTTHAQSLRVFLDWSEIVGLRQGDRYLVVNPFFHTFGYKAGILACLMRGATILPEAVFDAGRVMARVAEEKVTVLPGPPTLHQSILDHPERGYWDLSSLRLCVTGAAVVPVEMLRRMRTEMSYETIITGYGLTECTGTATMCRAGDPIELVAATSGRAIPDTEVRVVDDEGHVLPPGEPGEVVVRGYNVMKGYLDDPKATAEAVDADGWLHTGDVGVMDDRGYLAITDRKKDMFIVGGFNAYPAEIENMLASHPSLGQVAVVGVPDDRLGEVGYAFVVPRPGAQVDTAGLVSWARQRMANYKVPRYFEVVESLPVNASGKVLKYELSTRARQAVRARAREAATR